MLPTLDETELRVLGCLMEKSVITPDQYPLTLNALTNACNQKSSREPVMALKPGEVLHGIRMLETKHLVRAIENFKRGTEKYTQRFCNTTYSEIQLEAEEFAVLTVLMLRGPQTPGELRTRCARLHEFSDNNAVVATAERLADRTEGALVTKLPRRPGRKDAEYMHLLGGEIDVDEIARSAPAEVTRPRKSGLEQRVTELEDEVARLRALIEPES